MERQCRPSRQQARPAVAGRLPDRAWDSPVGVAPAWPPFCDASPPAPLWESPPHGPLPNPTPPAQHAQSSFHVLLSIHAMSNVLINVLVLHSISLTGALGAR
eukprot:115386-Chlamydomonas_euryale.AAC.5